MFTKDAGFSFAALTERARQTAYLVPGLTISIREEPAPHLDGNQAQDGDQAQDHAQGQAQDQAGPERVKQEAFRFDGGISEFCWPTRRRASAQAGRADGATAGPVTEVAPG